MDLSAIQQKALKNEVVVLDVREQDEWDDGHLKVARLIPLSVLQDEAACAEAVAGLDKEIPIYCHCKAGVRAQYGADILKQLGFEVTPMTMKYDTIVSAGFEESKEP